jgi:hypothetical protein
LAEVCASATAGPVCPTWEWQREEISDEDMDCLLRNQLINTAMPVPTVLCYDENTTDPAINLQSSMVRMSRSDPRQVDDSQSILERYGGRRKELCKLDDPAKMTEKGSKIMTIIRASRARSARERRVELEKIRRRKKKKTCRLLARSIGLSAVDRCSPC